MRGKILSAIFLFFLVLSPFFLIKYRNSTKKEKEEKYRIIDGVIFTGDCIINILQQSGISSNVALSIANKLSTVFNTRSSNIGDRYRIYFDNENGNFIKFVYYSVPLDFYTVQYDEKNKDFFVSSGKVKAEKEILGVKGEINSSLYDSMIKQNVNSEIIIQFAEIFASKIDFFTDCKKGDKFVILWESYKDKKGNILKDIKVVAGEYINYNNTYYAFYFEPQDNKKGGYYDENGQSVETAFLKSPLNYRRISSYFSYRRFHPIHKIYQPHLGIDYVAPAGTPVSSIGEGVIIFAGFSNNGYGNNVKIKHPNGYISYYGHLSKIKKGIKKGISVKKGEVIGFVGMTGLATGHHLDYRIKKNDKFINFLKLKLPPSYPIDKKYIPEFEKIKEQYIEKMSTF
ncbi:MAG TPA: peptidoglycan DD-metalloendopeptidase family protein [bacterium]|nr:peptidoglycan DD-metalloendopeptidase family protein [bacterium]